MGLFRHLYINGYCNLDSCLGKKRNISIFSKCMRSPSASHYSNSPLQVTIKQTSDGEMKFRITVVNANDRSVAISIQHGREVLFEDFTGRSTYENIFNLSALEDGDYVVLITSGKERITRTIHIQTETKVDRQVNIQ
jgi:hypothetical protein